MKLKVNETLYTNGYHDCHGDYRTEVKFENEKLPLYSEQSKLPQLPIPPLEQTLALYLETVEALLSKDEYENTKKLVNEFKSANGMGHELQKRLFDRREHQKGTSWLATWWNQLGYLQVRDPVVFNVSYFFHFQDSNDTWQKTQIGRAAALLNATMEFRDAVVSGQLEPERIGGKKTPLCATAYKYMFNACRIPQRNQDCYRLYDPANHQHVVVMRNNKFFTFDLICPTTGEVLSFEQLSMLLEQVIVLAGSKESAVGSLTSMNRDDWADARDRLFVDGNEHVLREIESAILLLCLDDTAPVSKTDVARALWHGDGRNRFFDKSIQLVVFENGKAGILAEHSMMDGMAMTVYADFILKRTAKDILPMHQGRIEQKALKAPKKLEFNVTRPTVDAIALAEKQFDDTVLNHEVHVRTFLGYGKSMIKSLKCSPDAYIQMAIQLAYRKLFGRSRGTYEASQVRVFFNGRTETTRSVSKASMKWLASMTNNAKSNASFNCEKTELLRNAVTSHVNYMRKAASGNGIDRHLLGLALCVKPGESCPLFKDPAYAISKTWHISTSHLTHESFDGWGWGEVVPDGVGIAYSIKNDACQFNIACRKNNWAEPLGHLIEESLLEMQAILQSQATLSSKL